MILDDIKSGNWFELFGELSLNGSVQYWLKEQVKEVDQAIIELQPGTSENSDRNYHLSALQLHTRKQLLEKQIEFFDALKEEFDAIMRREQ